MVGKWGPFLVTNGHHSSTLLCEDRSANNLTLIQDKIKYTGQAKTLRLPFHMENCCHFIVVIEIDGQDSGEH